MTLSSDNSATPDPVPSEYAIWCHRVDGYCGWLGVASGGLMVPWVFPKEKAEAEAERLARAPDSGGHVYSAHPAPPCPLTYNEAVWRSWKGLEVPPV